MRRRFKPKPSPFKWGFGAALGYGCAMIVLTVGAAVVLFILASVF